MSHPASSSQPNLTDADDIDWRSAASRILAPQSRFGIERATLRLAGTLISKIVNSANVRFPSIRAL
jgi:hypothetical protein